MIEIFYGCSGRGPGVRPFCPNEAELRANGKPVCPSCAQRMQRRAYRHKYRHPTFAPLFGSSPKPLTDQAMAEALRDLPA